MGLAAETRGWPRLSHANAGWWGIVEGAEGLEGDLARCCWQPGGVCMRIETSFPPRGSGSDFNEMSPGSAAQRTTSVSPADNGTRESENDSDSVDVVALVPAEDVAIALADFLEHRLPWYQRAWHSVRKGVSDAVDYAGSVVSGSLGIARDVAVTAKDTVGNLADWAYRRYKGESDDSGDGTSGSGSSDADQALRKDIGEFAYIRWHEWLDPSEVAADIKEGDVVRNGLLRLSLAAFSASTQNDYANMSLLDVWTESRTSAAGAAALYECHLPSELSKDEGDPYRGLRYRLRVRPTSGEESGAASDPVEEESDEEQDAGGDTGYAEGDPGMDTGMGTSTENDAYVEDDAAGRSEDLSELKLPMPMRDDFLRFLVSASCPEIAKAEELPSRIEPECYGVWQCRPLEAWV